MFSEMYVEISDETGLQDKTIILEYQIRETKAAQIWAGQIDKGSKDIRGVRERDRFDNFPGNDRDTLEHLLGILRDTINGLKPLHPNLDFPEVDLGDLQKSINYLHFHFAHSNNVTKVINEKSKDLWTRFNLILHSIEQKLIPEAKGIRNSALIFTWFNSPGIKIPEESYFDFCLNLEFGVAYAQYCEVGRTFTEMFWAGDDELDDAHIVPSQFINGDTFLWFGPSRDHFWARQNFEDLKAWFMDRKERFERIGYLWGDPRLALGQIPVARLKNAFYNDKEIANFVQSMAGYNCIKNVWLK